jgi:hypothetical protein
MLALPMLRRIGPEHTTDLRAARSAPPRAELPGPTGGADIAAGAA